MIALVVVIGFVLNRPNHDSPLIHRKANATDIEFDAPTPAKPVQQKSVPRSAPSKPDQTKQIYTKVNESEPPSPKPPAAYGPIKLFKGLYQDESRDPTYESLERQIRAQFDPKIFPLERLHTVSCRKSICKIAVFWSLEQQMVMAGVIMNVAPILSSHYAFESVTEPDKKGYVLIEMYILRKGFDPEDLQGSKQH